MITALLLTMLQTTLPVDTKPSDAKAVDTRVMDSKAADEAAAKLRLEYGGIEAPAQPTSVSESTWTRTPRFAPVGLTRPAGDFTTPISSLAAVRGQEDNTIIGVGLVTGLAGTGDSIDAGKQLMSNFLRTRNIRLDPQALASKNVAIVQVECNLPAGIKPGRRVDVTVSAIGDADSLVGGTLLFTELTDVTGLTVYATASGPLTVGGFSAGGQAASAKKNHTTVGMMPSGGKVEREVPTTLVSEHGFIYLDLKLGHDTIANCVRIAESINSLYPKCAATSVDGKSIQVSVPRDLPDSMHAAYLQTMLEREIVSKNVARVLVSERSGTIVMGGDVRLRPGAIAQGAITVTIAESPTTSQPGPLSAGQTRTQSRTKIDVKEDDTGLVFVPGAVTLQEVVDVLNVLGTTPRDLITILELMAQGGLLEAEIRRM
ncbi:MAG: flagellar basal body P-ring protein FlgI [Planctomycetota bacterium]|nr:flagellar basal body P-ring protein FlgI [Planctomycetota bacterium]